MSVQAITWALEQQIVRDPTARHVLVCLANYAGKQGEAAFPSAASLAADTGLSERTVRSKLDSLEAAGAIVRGNQAIAAAYIARADRRPVCYDLCMSRPAIAAPRGDERGANDAPRSGETGCNSRSNGVQMAQERGAGAAPDPSCKPSMNRLSASQADKRPAARASRLPEDWALPKAWGEWALAETQQLAGDLKDWAGGAWTPEHVRFEADKFRDYWRGKSGKDAAKADWLATWRNWVRNAGPLRTANGRKGGGNWRASAELALAKAIEVGVGPAWPGESHDAYCARIQLAIDDDGAPPVVRSATSPVTAEPQKVEPRAAMPADTRQALLDAAKRSSVPRHLNAGAV